MTTMTKMAKEKVAGISEVKRCVRCIMPENYPGVTLDSDGVCSFCRYYDEKWGQWVASDEERRRSEEKLRKIFESAKRKNRPYDAIIGVSGGKDSSYCLYLCKEIYGLNVLAFTKESCFLDESARKRIDRLVDIFKVPHIYYKDPMSPQLAAIFLRKTGNFCTACQLSAFNTTAVLAREYNIPLIILGNSSRTEAPAPKIFNPWDTFYFKNVMKNEGYKERIRNSFYQKNFLVAEGIRHYLGTRQIVLLPNFVEWDEEKIAELFKEKYDYPFGVEHSDCWAHEAANYLYQVKCGGFHPNDAKNSMLVRTGKMSREQAMTELTGSVDISDVGELDRLLETLGVSIEEFVAAGEKTPQEYITGVSKFINFVRRKVRGQKA